MLHHPFKILISSLGLSNPGMAALLGKPVGTVNKWAAGQRRVPDEILRRGEDYFRQIEKAALAFQDRPQLLARARLNPVLLPAVRRRIQEMKIVGWREKI